MNLVFIHIRTFQVESLVSTGAPPTQPNAPNRANVIENGWKVRRNTAQQFTSFVKFAKPLVDFKAGLQPLVADLTHDRRAEVRAGMAACLCPVIYLVSYNAKSS